MVGADRGQDVAAGEIDEHRTSAERLEPGSGTGIGPFEPKDSGQIQLLGETLNEGGDVIRIAVTVVMNPK